VERAFAEVDCKCAAVHAIIASVPAWFSRTDDLGLTFIGPFPLIPLWQAHHWFISRWVRHDCEKQPITCRLEWFSNIDPFKRWTVDDE